MEKEFDKYAKGEVKISRIEFAEKCADVTNRILENVEFDSRESTLKVKAMITAFLALLMEEVFENSDLEVEDD